MDSKKTSLLEMNLEEIRLRFRQYMVAHSLDPEDYDVHADYNYLVQQMVLTITRGVYSEKLDDIEVEFYFPETWYDHLKQTLNECFGCHFKIKRKRHVKVMNFTLDYPDFKPRPKYMGIAIRTMTPAEEWGADDEEL